MTNPQFSFDFTLTSPPQRSCFLLLVQADWDGWGSHDALSPVRTIDAIDSTQKQVGDQFLASLEEPLRVDGNDRVLQDRRSSLGLR